MGLAKIMELSWARVESLARLHICSLARLHTVSCLTSHFHVDTPDLLLWQWISLEIRCLIAFGISLKKLF